MLSSEELFSDQFDSFSRSTIDKVVRSSLSTTTNYDADTMNDIVNVFEDFVNKSSWNLLAPDDIVSRFTLGKAIRYIDTEAVIAATKNKTTGHKRELESIFKKAKLGIIVSIDKRQHHALLFLKNKKRIWSIRIHYDNSHLERLFFAKLDTLQQLLKQCFQMRTYS